MRLQRGPVIWASLVALAALAALLHGVPLLERRASQTREAGVARLCRADQDFHVWEEYRTCIHTHRNETPFHDHLREAWKTGVQLPWMNPIGCAVLVEFRPLEKQLLWSVGNALDNLPVSWCIHIAGSAAVLDVIREAFPVEILVQKIRFLDLMRDDMSQVTPLSAQSTQNGSTIFFISHVLFLLPGPRTR